MLIMGDEWLYDNETEAYIMRKNGKNVAGMINDSEWFQKND